VKGLHLWGMNQLTVFILLFYISGCTEVDVKTKNISRSPSIETTSAIKKPVLNISPKIKGFLLKNKNFNQQYCFLIDMSVSSGKRRFYVYDPDKDSVLTAGLVAHGSCNTSGLVSPQYSNQNGSGCSSLGRYKIGYKYTGRFGPSYKLHGLDSTNNNAFGRAIVLHSYDCVPDYELMEAAICNSLGCPMVSPAFFEQLETLIDDSKKSILLWIYEGTPTANAYALRP
jgi:hypothetical protein